MSDLKDDLMELACAERADWGDTLNAEMICKAADRIAELEAEVERLEAAAVVWQSQNSELEAEVERLKAERDDWKARAEQMESERDSERELREWSEEDR